MEPTLDTEQLATRDFACEPSGSRAQVRDTAALGQPTRQALRGQTPRLRILRPFALDLANDVAISALRDAAPAGAEDLDARLRRLTVLSLADCQRVLDTVAPALDEASWYGTMHDLRRARIVFESSPGEMGETVTLRGAPDPREPHAARTDVLALAALLYRGLTGLQPFRSEQDALTVSGFLREEVTAPTRLRPALPQGLDAFFARALAVDPDDRFLTAAALREAFLVALDGAGRRKRAPTTALPRSRAERVRAAGWTMLAAALASGLAMAFGLLIG